MLMLMVEGVEGGGFFFGKSFLKRILAPCLSDILNRGHRRQEVEISIIRMSPGGEKSVSKARLDNGVRTNSPDADIYT